MPQTETPAQPKKTRRVPFPPAGDPLPELEQGEAWFLRIMLLIVQTENGWVTPVEKFLSDVVEQYGQGRAFTVDWLKEQVEEFEQNVTDLRRHAAELEANLGRVDKPEVATIAGRV